MGAYIVAKKVDEDQRIVRYAFGFGEEFDRTLTFDKDSGDVVSDDGNYDSSFTKITIKINRQWRDGGEFPSSVVFAS